MSFFVKTQKSRFCLGVLLCLGIFAQHCTFSKPSAEDDPKPKETKADKQKREKQQKELNELSAEIDVGRNMAGRLLNFYGVLDDHAVVTYVNEVGAYIGSVSDHPERHYMFAVLDSEAVNAFACPGGYILVTLGSIRLAENEAELAGILGHEVAHVGEKHMFNTLTHSDANPDDKGKEARAETTKVRERETLGDEKSATGDMLARYVSGSTSAGMGLLKAAKEGMYLILEKGLDKKLEYDADQLGVRYAVRAGYEPKGLYNFLDRLEKEKKKLHLDTSVLDKTHPKLIERKDRISNLLKQMDASGMVGATVEDRFLKVHVHLPTPSKKQK